MARRPGLDPQSVRGGLGELKRRLLFVIGALITSRIDSFISIPGIGTAILAKLLEQQRGTIIEMFGISPGGALSRASIFALGIIPYISASITIQLLTMVHPTLAETKKEGESGHRKTSQYIRCGTLVLAIFQSIDITIGLPNMPGMQGLVTNPGFVLYFTAIVSLVTGTMFLMWLSEQVTEWGIGNGISITIFTGIIAGLPPAITHTIEQTCQGDLHFLVLLLAAVLVSAVTLSAVFIEYGQRHIVANCAKYQQGHRIYAVQSTHLPLRMNMAGVIPAVFVSNIVLLSTIIASWSGGGTSWSWLTTISLYLQSGQPLYVLLYVPVIIFSCFFYTASAFNPHETADNLKKPGVLVPEVHPGKQATKYTDRVMTRLTLIDALYITLICLIPEFMCDTMKVPFYFGGTSLLIAVVVIMDLMARVQTLTMPSQHESALKKTSLKGYGR